MSDIGKDKQPKGRRNTKKIDYKLLASKGKISSQVTTRSDTENIKDYFQTKLDKLESSIQTKVDAFNVSIDKLNVENASGIMPQMDKSNLDMGKFQLKDNITTVDFDPQAQEIYLALKEEIKSFQIAVLDLLKDFSSSLSEVLVKCSLLEEKQDKREQYQRRNSLLLHGIEENPNESTDDIVIKFASTYLQYDLKQSDLDRSHRLGVTQSKKTKPRLIIMKFTSYRIKASMFALKSKLKGKGILLTENLTTHRRYLLTEVKNIVDMKKVWTTDGVIKVALPSGKKLSIKSTRDLQRLGDMMT